MRIGRRALLFFILLRANLLRQIQIAPISSYGGYLHFIQLDEISTIFIEGGRIARDEGSIKTHSNVQGRPVTRDDQFLGKVRAHYDQSPRALAPFHCPFGSLAYVCPTGLIIMSNQLGNHLGIGTSLELIPQFHQLLSQILLIEERPVVDDGNLARGIDVGMCIAVGDATVCRPAGVSYADGMAVDWMGGIADHLDGIELVVDAGFLHEYLQ